MSYIISQIISLIKLLHSENGSKQIAAGLTLGLLLGLSPLISLQGLIIIILLLILRVQIGAAFAMAAVTKVLSIMMVAPLALVGEKVLSLNQLKPLFTLLYNLPLFPYTNFNHSVVMGGLVISIILALAFSCVPIFDQQISSRSSRKNKEHKTLASNSSIDTLSVVREIHR